MPNQPWSSSARFKYQRGQLVTVDTMPGVWKVYSPHGDKGFYWLEPHDETARSLMSIADRNSSGLVFTPTSVHGRGCTVDTEWGMLVSPVGDITRITASPDTIPGG